MNLVYQRNLGMDGEVQQMMLTHVESEIAWFMTERILRSRKLVT